MRTVPTTPTRPKTGPINPLPSGVLEWYESLHSENHNETQPRKLTLIAEREMNAY
jgi:hypothetical protein